MENDESKPSKLRILLTMLICMAISYGITGLILLDWDIVSWSNWARFGCLAFGYVLTVSYIRKSGLSLLNITINGETQTNIYRNKE